MRSPVLYLSPGNCSSGLMIAVPRPRSTRTTRPCRRCTVPMRTSPSCSLYSLYVTSRSASRNFCVMTCLAVMAAIRPNSLGTSNSVRIMSPSFAPFSNSCAGVIITSVFGLNFGVSSSGSSISTSSPAFAGFLYCASGSSSTSGSSSIS